MKKFALVILVVLASACAGKGIVTVKGWKHGVALCNGNGDAPMTDIHNGWMWMRDGIMYTVNDGHLGDDQYLELVRKAKVECARFGKE